MRFTTSLLSHLALLTGGVSAFPSYLIGEANADPKLLARANEILERQTGADAATKIFEPKPIFDADAQYVDVSPGSGHEWVAPGPNDLRGPCPGLNAFANHGFLPHNGYATIAQFIDATTNVVGMGPNLAAVLSVFGAAIDGDGTAWSIGGTPPASIAGVLGSQAHGISGSHNKYESDASPTRPDLYEYGNDYKTRVQQFQELINMSPGSVTLDSLTAFRSKRFDEQIAGNPYFFNGPFTGVLVQPAAYTFIYRFMANHSEANPYGLLDYDVIQSWFAISGSSGSYKVKQGYERIPGNWYKRAVQYPYENDYFLADAANAALLHPKFLDIGGNTGKVNTFTGVNVNDFTGGIYNAANLAKGDKFACLAYQFAAQAKPDIALNVLNIVGSAINKVTSSLSCPQLKKFDNSQLKQFPGYTRSPAA